MKEMIKGKPVLTALLIALLALTAAGCGKAAVPNDDKNTAGSAAETAAADETKDSKEETEETLNTAEETGEIVEPEEVTMTEEEQKAAGEQTKEAEEVQKEAEKAAEEAQSDIPADPDYDGLYGPIFNEAVKSESSDHCCAYFSDTNGDGIAEMWLDRGGSGSTPESYEVYTIRSSGALLVENGSGFVPYELNNDFPAPRARIDYGFGSWPGWSTIMGEHTY